MMFCLTLYWLLSTGNNNEQAHSHTWITAIILLCCVKLSSSFVISNLIRVNRYICLQLQSRWNRLRGLFGLR